MNVFVTGATGFLGAPVVRRLLEQRHHVKALVEENDSVLSLNNLPIEFIKGDILKPSTFVGAMQNCEAVIHCAGKVSLRACGRKSMAQINVAGTRLVAEQAKALGVKRLVYISSVGVLGANNQAITVKENRPASKALKQKHHYHQSKIKAEKIVLSMADTSFEVISVLPTMLWGPGDWKLSSTGYALYALKGGTLFYPSQAGGACILDVDDAAEGVVAALEKGRSNERYILAGENITVKEMCQKIANAIGPSVKVKAMSMAGILIAGAFAELLGLLGVDIDFSMDIYRQSGNYWWADATKAKKELGFKTTYTADQSIKRAVEWYRDNIQKLKD